MSHRARAPRLEPPNTRSDGRLIQCFGDDHCTARARLTGPFGRESEPALLVALRERPCACGKRLCKTCTPEDENECLDCHRSHGCDHYGYPCHAEQLEEASDAPPPPDESARRDLIEEDERADALRTLMGCPVCRGAGRNPPVHGQQCECCGGTGRLNPDGSKLT